MEDALFFCSFTEILPVAFLGRNGPPQATPPAEHAQGAVSQYSELPVDRVRAAQKAQHRAPAWHQFVHGDVQTHVAPREFQSCL